MTGWKLGVFFLILSLGTWMRFHALDRQSLWNDEMSTRYTSSLSFSAWPEHFQTYEAHPPLYFLQMRVWQRVCGNSLKALRANSALWGSAGVICLYFLAAFYGGPACGLAAMALMAFSPYHLAYSQELRPYALAITLALLSLLLLEYVLRHEERRWVWIFLAAVWTTELFTHYWGSFVVLAQWLYGLEQAKSRRAQKAFLVTGLVSCGAFSLWFPVLFRQLHVIDSLGGFWVPPPSPVNLFKTFLAFCGLFFHFASSTFIGWGSLVFKIAVGLAYSGVLIAGLRRGPHAARLWLLIGLGLPYLLSYWKPGVYVWYRYPSLIYPAFILLAVGGVWALPSAMGRGALIALFVTSGLGGCWQYFTVWQKANPKAVVAYIDTLQTPDSVVVRPSYFGDLFSYYHRGSTRIIDEDKLDSLEKRAALKGRTILFTAFDVPSDPVGDALRSDFHVVSARYFPGFAHLGITVYQLN